MQHRRIIPLLFLALLSLEALAQNGQQGRSWEYWGNVKGYMNDQAEVVLGLIDQTLSRHPASTKPSEERQLALASLDALVHDTRNDGSPALHKFLNRRIARVANQLKSPFKKKGIEVFKLYNDGFVVRSGGITAGFDLCGTCDNVNYISDSLMRAIVDRCDVLFISHRDADHADRKVVEMAAGLGIPVYAPKDYNNPKVEGVRADSFECLSLRTRGGKYLQVQPFLGHQDDIQNNIYVVTFPGGRTFAHCGDQYNKGDLAWLEKTASMMSRQLDILVIDCWAMEMEATIRGFDPRLVISGHENELGHGIDHREAFWLTQYKFDTLSLPCPSLILCWGERYRYK